MEKMQVKVDLVGKDGNIFNLKSIFRKAAIRQGYSEDEVNALFEEMENAKDIIKRSDCCWKTRSSEDEDEDEDDDDDDDDGWWNYCDD